MKFDKMVDILDKKSTEPETMTLDRFMELLSPSEKKELKKAEEQSRKKSDSKRKKREG